MTEQQIERLEEMIWGFMEDPVGVDEIQATFAAIAAGPKLVKPGQWLPFLFDESEAEYPYVEKGESDEFMDLLLTLYNETMDSVRLETFAPFFRYYEDDEDEMLDPVPWCTMFHLAFELHGENTIHEDNEVLLQLFTPVAYFLNPEAFYDEFKNQNEEMDYSQEDVREVMMDALHVAVYDLRDYFHPPQHADGASPAGRVLPFDPPGTN